MGVPATTNPPYSGIYKILNTKNGKMYIGLSKDVYSRMKKHLWLLKNNKHYNKHLQSSFNKNGEQYFTFEVIEICSIEKLDEKEKYYINYYDSMNNGYNLKTGGHVNTILSEETRSKISMSNKGKTIPFDVRLQISTSLKGFKHSEETKRKLSLIRSGKGNPNYKKGHLFSEERRKKLSNINKGRKHTDEHIKNMILARFGKYYTFEDKLEMYRLNKEDKLSRIKIAEMFELNRKTVGNYIKDVEKELLSSSKGVK